MHPSKQLGFAAAMVGLACGSEAIIVGPAGGGGAGAQGGAMGGGGQTAAPTIAVTSTSAGAGGMLPTCMGAHTIDVEEPAITYDRVCDWGSRSTSRPVGYEVVDKEPGSMRVIEGCLLGSSEPFRMVVPGSGTGTFTDVDLVVGVYWSRPKETTVTISRFEEVGGAIEGTFETVLNNIDQDFESRGRFCVQRVSDLLMP